MAETKVLTTASEKLVKENKKPNYWDIAEYTQFEFAQKRDNKGSFTKDGTKNSANPITINSPRKFILLPTSKHFLGVGHGYAMTQYIPNANTIFVDDYFDKQGNSQKGLKSQGYDLKEEARMFKINGTPISFNGAGILDLRKHDNDPALVAFINSHEMNVESPAGKQKSLTVVSTHKFRPLKKEEKAQKVVASFDDKMEVYDMIRSLRTKKGDSSFAYNELEINAYLRTLGVIVETRFGPGENAQKYTHLLEIAEKAPKEFKDVVERGLIEVEEVVAKANAFEMAAITGVSIIVKLDGQSREIHKFTEKVPAEKLMREAAIAMISSSNMYNEYIRLKNEVEARN